MPLCHTCIDTISTGKGRPHRDLTPMLRPSDRVTAAPGAQWFTPAPTDLTVHLAQADVDKSAHDEDPTPQIQAQLGAIKPRHLCRAHRRCDAHALLRTGEFFAHPEALLLAEMDATHGRIFTSPPPTRGTRQVVHFADFSPSASGFAELLVTVLKWRAHGFVLAPPVASFHSNAPTHSLHVLHTGGSDSGAAGLDRALVAVWAGTRSGLHVALAGGPAAGTQLVWQCAACLGALGPGGVLVCQLPGSAGPLGLDLVRVLSLCFHSISLARPQLVHPVSKDQFLVGKGLCTDTARVGRVLQHLRAALAPEVPLSRLATVREPKLEAHLRITTRAVLAGVARHWDRVRCVLAGSSPMSRAAPVDQAHVRETCLLAWGVTDMQCPYRRHVHWDPAWGVVYFDRAHRPTDRWPTLRDAILQERQEMHHTLVPHAPRSYVQASDLCPAAHWVVFAVPPGGQRVTLVSQAGRVVALSQSGREQALGIDIRLPGDVVLDAVCVEGAAYVLDAWSLPSPNPDDVQMWLMRPKFRDRTQLLHMFVWSLRQRTLRYATPHSFEDFLKSPIRGTDLFLLHGEGSKPSRNYRRRRGNTDCSFEQAMEVLRKACDASLQKTAQASP